MHEITDRLAENVAAISASVHSHPDYMQLYKSIREEVSGFPGIWQLCAVVGREFTEAESRRRHIAGETYEWIDAIHDIVGRVYEVCIDGDGTNSVRWSDEAEAAIETFSFNEDK